MEARAKRREASQNYHGSARAAHHLGGVVEAGHLEHDELLHVMITAGSMVVPIAVVPRAAKVAAPGDWPLRLLGYVSSTLS